MPEEDHGQHQAEQPDPLERPGEANTRQDGGAPSLEVRGKTATQGQASPHTLAHSLTFWFFDCCLRKVERDPAGQERPGVDERRGRPPARLPEGERQQVARLRQVRECRPDWPGVRPGSRVEEAKALTT